MRFEWFELFGVGKIKLGGNLRNSEKSVILVPIILTSSIF